MRSGWFGRSARGSETLTGRLCQQPTQKRNIHQHPDVIGPSGGTLRHRLTAPSAALNPVPAVPITYELNRTWMNKVVLKLFFFLVIVKRDKKPLLDILKHLVVKQSELKD